MSEARYCATCGKEIEKSYIKVLDNYLQVKYFDSDEINCFCCNECLCEFISAEEIYLDEEESERDEE